jgi:hypothetical protein
MERSLKSRLFGIGLLFAHLGSPQKTTTEKPTTEKPEAAVRSSQYLRAQAQLYFDIARLLIEPKAIEEARATATQYLAQAEEMERAEHISSERAMAR